MEEKYPPEAQMLSDASPLDAVKTERAFPQFPSTGFPGLLLAALKINKKMIPRKRVLTFVQP